MNYISRSLEKVVRQVTKEYPVVLVTGPRQVGKTTMLQKMMEETDRGYVSLDDLSERSIAKNDPELFLQLHKPPVLIDEVQYAPELITYIKIHVDKYHEAGAFWLTESQIFKLMKGVQESLAGRVAVLSMTFLSQAEISAGKMEPFTVAEIARDADINQKQAKDWLLILETLGIIFYLHPYSDNLLKRLVKTPKLYFYDTGLVCYLTRWSSAETLESGTMNGAILENYVVSEIMKTYLNSGKQPFMYYYRDKDAKEIDVILEHDGVLNPIEIKKTSNPGTKLTKVSGLLDKASTPRSKGAVICMKPALGAVDKDNYIVPIWMI